MNTTFFRTSFLVLGLAGCASNAGGGAAQVADDTSSTKAPVPAPPSSPYPTGSGTGTDAPPGYAVSDDGGVSVEAAAPLMTVPAYHVRYLTMNIGNVAIGCDAYENKLCTPDVSDQIRLYLTTWKPDLILISEVLDEPQLTRTIFESDIMAGGDPTKNLGGPVLPDIPAFPYAVSCHPSVDRNTGIADTDFVMDNPKASHRHECVVYNTKKFSLVSEDQVYGPNQDAWHNTNCNYDFTARSADLKFLGGPDAQGNDIVITGIAVHPPSNPISPSQTKCRVEEISQFWTQLAANKPRVIIGGDWNTGKDDELQKPANFAVNYSRGQHFGLATHDGEYSAQYILLGNWQYDHAFTNFGTACTNCGQYYRGASQDLAFGSALGQYDGHPWAAQPGLDHRQVLVDLSF